MADYDTLNVEIFLRDLADIDRSLRCLLIELPAASPLPIDDIRFIAGLSARVAARAAALAAATAKLSPPF